MEETLEDLIKKVESNKRKFEKASEMLLKIIKASNEDIEKIYVREGKTLYAMPHPGYSTKTFKIVVILKEGTSKFTGSLVGRKIIKSIKDFIGIDMSEYGSGLDLEIYIVTLEKIWG
jgi:hypothetical protein